jgi:putative PIN family toxin of toxin-antitoxin system
MRLVLDTDVVRSGLQSATGASRLLLAGVEEGAFVPLVSVATVLEYEDVLTRPETLEATGMTVDDVVAFLDGFADRAERVSINVRSRPSIKDPSDEMFVEAFVNGDADYIVTFNRRDYLPVDERLASKGETVVPLLKPGEALGRMKWRPKATTLCGFRRR